MTSRVSFFNIIKQDMRHKVWLWALSTLGSFMAQVVLLMLYLPNFSERTHAFGGNTIKQSIYQFCNHISMISNGMVAIVGALIVGLTGFGFLFHKNMIDNYHSMPVKRKTIFWTIYLEGFLIWLVPFAVNQLLSMLYILVKLQQFDSLSSFGKVFAAQMNSNLLILICFLLVYHLCILAVMLCGNVLNTLVVTAVFGVGFISLYGIGYGMFSFYMATFWGRGRLLRAFLHLSPAIEGPYLIYEKGSGYGFMAAAVIDLLIIGLMLFAARYFYGKRASELAEQGVKNKPVSMFLRSFVTVVAGMAGWMFFAFIGETLLWGIFGAVLVGIIVYGVMDIIFQMDFKAFFSHKWVMLGTVAVVILLGITFSYDLIGYDSYLPKEADIAELAIYDDSFVVTYMRDNEVDAAMDQMHIKDQKGIYELLEAATKRVYRGKKTYGLRGLFYGYYDDYMAGTQKEYINLKITLKDGYSYYRHYRISEEEAELYFKLLYSNEYAQQFYTIPYEDQKINRFYIEGTRYETDFSAIPREAQNELLKAYNKDVEQNGPVIMRGDSQTLAKMRVTLYNGDIEKTYYLLIDDCMTETREMLKQLGYESLVAPLTAEELDSVWIMEYMIKDQYGNMIPEQNYREDEDLMYGVKIYDGEYYYLQITDPEELNMILRTADYHQPYSMSWFAGNARFSDVTLHREANEYDHDIILTYRWPLPQEWLDRFQTEGIPAGEMTVQFNP